MSVLTKLTGAIALITCFSAPVQATMITGNIGFTGSVNTTGGTTSNAPGSVAASADIFQSATGLHFLPGSIFTSTGTQDGAYATVGGQVPVAYNDFVFNAFNGPIAPLWKFVSNGNTYSFNLNTVNIDAHTSTALVLSGSGLLNISGFDATPGQWVLTANRNDINTNTAFNFSTDNTAVKTNVPEPIELSLLGAGLAMLIRRRMQAK